MKPNAAATRVRWLIFALSCLTSWFLYLHRYTWNFVRPALEQEYGFSNTELGTLEGLFNASYAVCQVPSGLICDFFGAHWFLGVIIIVWSVSMVGMTLTGNFHALGAIRLLFGVSQAGAYPSLAKVTRVWFPEANRTILQGWIASFFGRTGGAMSSVLMGTVLIGYFHLDWRTALVVLAAFGVLFGAVFLWLFRSSPEVDQRVNPAELELIHQGQPRKPATDGPRVLPFGRALKNFTVDVFIVQQFLNAGADAIYVSLMGSYFMNARGIDIAQAGVMASLPLIGGALGGAAGGFLNDWLIAATGSRRWGRSLVGFTGKFLACLMMFVAIRQQNVTYAALGLMATKFFTDWTQPTVWGACTDLGGRYSATLVGIINMSGNLGAAVMPLVFGIVLDFYKTQELVAGQTVEVTNYNPVFVIVACMYLLTAGCWFLIDCTKSIDP